jgi:hypothetical protein
MAVTVARVHLAMAHAAMSGLLPTPPEWKMLPLLPTPPCAAAPSPPKPSRADAVERWDACKSAPTKSPPRPCRADAAEHWDASKSSSDGKSKSSSSAGRATSCERWDVNKTSPTSSFSSSSCDKWEERTKRPVSRGSSSSAERWDAHKEKPRSPQADGQSSAGSNDDTGAFDEPQPQMGPYAGQGFLAVAPPEPTMLPVPSSFLVLPRFIAA